MENKGSERFQVGLDKDLGRLAGMVAMMEDREPPSALIDSVMGRLQPKKSGLIRRVLRRIRTPIRVTPLKFAPLAASLIIAILLGLSLFDGPPRQDGPTRQDAIPSRSAGMTVLFTLDMPNASQVELIGSFSQWKPGRYRMLWNERLGLWELSVGLDGGRYEYAFLVDGKKVVPDPKAVLQQDDGFGNRNSVLIIERSNSHDSGI
jgi:hypothetical protein